MHRLYDGEREASVSLLGGQGQMGKVNGHCGDEHTVRQLSSFLQEKLPAWLQQPRAPGPCCGTRKNTSLGSSFS